MPIRQNAGDFLAGSGRFARLYVAMTQSDQIELARRAAAGDAAALDAFWAQHRRWVAAVLLAHKPTHTDLDDLLQEVAMSVCEHIHKLRQPERFLPWLRSIALNRARSQRRSEASRQRMLRPLREQDEPTEYAAPDTDSDADHVLEAIQRLPEEYREPLIMKSVRGLSQRQVATILGLPETTVETRLVRARKLLRLEMARDDVLPKRLTEPRAVRTRGISK